MIKRFYQLNEGVKGLKDSNFFTDYFTDLLDEHNYKLEIKSITYVKDDINSNFPKEGFYPNYNLSISPKNQNYKNLESIRDLNFFNEICKSFTIGLESLLSSSEINPKIVGAIYISHHHMVHTFPRFEFNISDEYEIPEEELPMELLFEEFCESINDIIRYLGYKDKIKIVKNEDANKLEIIANCKSQEFSVFIKRLGKHLDYAEKRIRVKDIITFDINVIQRKVNDYHVDLLNPQKLERNF